MHFALTAVLLLITSVSAGAAERTIWSCRTSNEAAQPLLHLVEWGSRSYVKFAHMRFSARHEVNDEMPGWYWHNDGSGYYRYAIVVDHDGKGWYHDFSLTGPDRSTAIDSLLCEKDG